MVHAVIEIGIVLVAIFLIGLLVLVHEMGHLFVAKRSGVRVLGFSIGFGRKLFTWRRGETEYSFSVIPLGGYVKMAGEQHSEQTSQPWEYLSKPIGTRALIVFAGPFVNYLVAILSIWLMFLTGYPARLPIVGQVVEDTPAQAAGLQVGDQIQTIDGRAIGTWEEMTKIIYASPNQPLSFAIKRNDVSQDVTITPRPKPGRDLFGRPKTIGLIGIVPSREIRIYRVGPVAAIGRTIQLQNEFIVQNFFGLWLVITGQVSMRETMGGPIAIVYLTTEAVREGLASTLSFVGVVSLCLAVFNLFPIPILDGGHLLFLAIEKLRGRPVSLNVQERSAQVSLVLLTTLVLVICINDVNRFGLLEKVVGWVRR